MKIKNSVIRYCHSQISAKNNTELLYKKTLKSFHVTYKPSFYPFFSSKEEHNKEACFKCLKFNFRRKVKSWMESVASATLYIF